MRSILLVGDDASIRHRGLSLALAHLSISARIIDWKDVELSRRSAIEALNLPADPVILEITPSEKTDKDSLADLLILASTQSVGDRDTESVTEHEAFALKNFEEAATKMPKGSRLEDLTSSANQPFWREIGQNSKKARRAFQSKIKPTTPR